LTTLNEGLARNLTNSLDVYLGTGLEVKLIDLEQLTMEDYRARSATSGYMLPCVAKPTANSILLEMDGDLMFTVIDLLLGGTGGVSGITRELTEIDEEILEDVGTMIAGQIERVWQPMGLSLVPGSCVKPNVGYRVFPPTEKVHRIHFELSMEGMAGGLYLALPASLSSHLVRNVRSDSATSKQGRGYQKPPSLEQRIMGCEFALAGELPELKVSVRDLARISVGSVLTLSAPAASPGQLTLEGKSYFVAAPVGQGNMKAMQLLSAAQIEQNDLDGNEDASHAGF
jgi:flagellar motor switch protein FliM